MDYVDFLISACMRHLPYFIERETSSRNYPPMFIGPQTDVKPPQITPQKFKTVIKSTSRSSQCRMTRHMQLSLNFFCHSIRLRLDGEADDIKVESNGLGCGGPKHGAPCWQRLNHHVRPTYKRRSADFLVDIGRAAQLQKNLRGEMEVRGSAVSYCRHRAGPGSRWPRRATVIINHDGMAMGMTTAGESS